MKDNPYLIPFASLVSGYQVLQGVYMDASTACSSTDPGEYGEAVGRILALIFTVGMGEQ